MVSDSDEDAGHGNTEERVLAPGAASGEAKAVAGPSLNPQPVVAARLRLSRTQRMLIGLSKEHSRKRPRVEARTGVAKAVTAVNASAHDMTAGAVGVAGEVAGVGLATLARAVHVPSPAVVREPLRAAGVCDADVSWIGRAGARDGRGRSADRCTDASRPLIRRSAAALSKDVLGAFDDDLLVAGASVDGALATYHPTTSVGLTAQRYAEAATCGPSRGGARGHSHATARGRGCAGRRRKPVIKLGPNPPVEGAVGAGWNMQPPKVAVAGTISVDDLHEEAPGHVDPMSSVDLVIGELHIAEPHGPVPSMPESPPQTFDVNHAVAASGARWAVTADHVVCDTARDDTVGEGSALPEGSDDGVMVVVPAARRAHVLDDSEEDEAAAEQLAGEPARGVCNPDGQSYGRVRSEHACTDALVATPPGASRATIPSSLVSETAAWGVVARENPTCEAMPRGGSHDAGGDDAAHEEDIPTEDVEGFEVDEDEADVQNDADINELGDMLSNPNTFKRCGSCTSALWWACMPVVLMLLFE